MKEYHFTEEQENFPQILCEPIAEYSRALSKHHNQQLSLFEEKRKDINATDIKVAELFAGVGGFRIGLERASLKYKTVWSNQWEPSTKKQDASIIYCKRFGLEGHSNVDITQVSVEELPEFDLLVGGFPCQDYSVATTLKKSGGIEGRKGVLWWEIQRILRDTKKRPEYLFLENVDRLLKSPATQRGRDFAIILASLADLGYLVEWRVINAAEYGMPQRRNRTYIVAYHESTLLAQRAEQTSSPFDWFLENGIIGRAFPCQKSTKSIKSIFKITDDLATISAEFNASTNKKAGSPFGNAGFMAHRQIWSVDVTPVYSGPYIHLGDLLIEENKVPESFYITNEDLAQWKYLKGCKSEKRINKSTGFEYHYTEGSMTFPDTLNKSSRTIITGEGGKSASRFKHVILTPSGRYRRLVPVELERLNMFPDEHTKEATDIRRAFLMGNALVTGVVEAIGRSLIDNIRH